jgi:hypothetical protein
MYHDLRWEGVLCSVGDPDPDPEPVLWIRDILVLIRLRILLFSSLTFKNQDANKKLIFSLSFCAYYFLKAHLHHFSEIKSHKEVTKQ